MGNLVGLLASAWRRRWPATGCCAERPVGPHGVARRRPSGPDGRWSTSLDGLRELALTAVGQAWYLVVGAMVLGAVGVAALRRAGGRRDEGARRARTTPYRWTARVPLLASAAAVFGDVGRVLRPGPVPGGPRTCTGGTTTRSRRSGSPCATVALTGLDGPRCAAGWCAAGADRGRLGRDRWS